MKKHVVALAAVLALVVAAGSAFAATSGTASALAKGKKHITVAQQLAQAKAALDKYQDVSVAKAAGYQPASPCESTPASAEASWWAGAMGVHFVNNALMKPGPLNPSKPPILVYLPTAGGGFQLVAAEYFKPDADQNVKTDGDRPTLFGRAFDGPMLGHAPGMPIHYDLHVWLWRHNPAGLFAPFDPDASCS